MATIYLGENKISPNCFSICELLRFVKPLFYLVFLAQKLAEEQHVFVRFTPEKSNKSDLQFSFWSQ